MVSYIVTAPYILSGPYIITASYLVTHLLVSAAFTIYCRY